MPHCPFRLVIVASLCAVLVAAAPPASGPSAKDIEALIAQLSSPDEKVRQAAQEKLIGMGDDARSGLEAYVRARAAAESALQKIDTNKVAGPTLLTLDLKELAAQNVIAEISKQTGFDIQASHESVWQQANPTPVTLSVDKQPFWAVLREACSKGGLTVYSSGYNDRRIRLTAASQMGQNAMKCPAVVSGAFMITVNSLQRTSTVDMANPQNISRSMHLQMMTFCEPKVRVTQYSYTPEMEEAVDDKGNSLLATGGGRSGPMRNMSSSRGIVWQMSVPLQYPADPGSKIAKLRGKIRFSVQTRSETLEVADVLKAKDAAKTVAGRRITVKEVRKLGDRQYQAHVILHRDGLDQQLFSDLVNSPNIRLVDADGQEFLYNGNSSSSGSNDAYELKMSFTARTGPGDAAAVGEPATLLWDIPTATQDVTIPFEFTDLPLP